jgi:hypothetical protein
MRLVSAAIRLPFKLTLAIVGRAASLAGLGRDPGEAPEAWPEPGPVATSQPAPPPRRRPNGGPPPPPQPREPDHVSEEPELVAEVAEAGAEEGAGAEVRVEEPWPGYARMTAAEIRTRLQEEPLAVAAAVSLYEASGKGRSSVLEAAARRTSALPSG